MSKIHYIGGIRARVGRAFRVCLRGWPVCGGGISQDRQSINPGTEITPNAEDVTCSRCRKLIEAQAAYIAELQSRARPICVRDRNQFCDHIRAGRIEEAAAIVIKYEAQQREAPR